MTASTIDAFNLKLDICYDSERDSIAEDQETFIQVKYNAQQKGFVLTYINNNNMALHCPVCDFNVTTNKIEYTVSGFHNLHMTKFVIVRSEAMEDVYVCYTQCIDNNRLPLEHCPSTVLLLLSQNPAAH